MTQLALGTAQFGSSYGISNATGRPGLSEIKLTLETAVQNGISMLDTAALYGNAEYILGQALEGEDNFKIISKLPGLSDLTEKLSIQEVFFDSLKNLKKDSIYGILLHKAENLLSDRSDQIYKALLKLKSDGFVEKIGFSSYYPDQVLTIIERYDIDLVQMPLNVLDQRFITSGCLERLKNKGVETHARSIFLQGLLLMEPSRIPAYFDDKKQSFLNYFNAVKKIGVDKVQAALNFIKSQANIDFAVVGVQNSVQLSEINVAWAAKPLRLNCQPYALEDEAVLIPSRWQL